MWLAYMDDAGNTGDRLDDADQPVHMITTLLCPEEHVRDVHDRMRSIARKYVPGDHDNDDFEFHGAEVFGNKKFFEGMAPQTRVDLFEDILSIIGSLGLKVVVRGVNKAGLRRRYGQPFHPYDIALMFSIEEVERFARAQKHANGDDCRVLLVADESREREARALRDLASYQRFGTTWGWKTTPVANVIDTIHFVRSASNWAIQLADCTSFIVSRDLRIKRCLVDGATQSSAAVSELYRRLILPHVGAYKIWHP